MRVYVVGRLADAWAPRHARALDAVRRAFPRAEIVDGVRAFDREADWRRSWPRLFEGVSLVVVVPGPRGEIGAGGLVEVAEALRAGLEVKVVRGGRLRDLGRIALPSAPSWNDVARVR